MNLPQLSSRYIRFLALLFALATAIFIFKKFYITDSGNELNAIIKLLSCDDIQGEWNTCSSLVRYGRNSIAFDGSKQWEPLGCQLQSYGTASPSIVRCFEISLKKRDKKQTVIVMIGDSRMRQLQYEIFRLVTGKTTAKTDTLCDPPVRPGDHDWLREQCNLTLQIPQHNLEIRRWWVTMLDSKLVSYLLESIPAAEIPDMIVINSGAWLLKHCYDTSFTAGQCAEKYTRLMKEIRPILRELSRLTKVIWMPQTPVDRNFATVFLTSSQNGMIPVFNQIASCVLSGTDVLFWWSSAEIFEYFADTHDGLHQGNGTLYLNAQILLNVVCNNVVFPNSSVCCSQ